jgi:ribulose-phosphate 3-epimerase
MVEILPSILSADFTRLGAEVEQVQRAGARMLHLDIMDGRFVPNISFGPGVVKAVRGITNCYLDVHLMIEDPDRYIKDFIEAGAQSISVHQETCPSTPVSLLEDVYDVLDYVLLMSVNPGFGGQQFIPRTLAKVIALDRRRAELGLNFPIEIDGGVTLANLAEIVRAGCDWVVAGSAIFDSEDPAATFSQMQQIAREATAVRV